MRIGIVDLDTSHPAAFAPLLAARGHEVVAVVGGTTVMDDAATAAYAAEHGIARVVPEPGDLVGLVDAAFVHTVDWDCHVDRVRPFVEAGVPVKVCKPFAGNEVDLARLEAWAAGGARIAGGSALRWCATADRLRAALGDGPVHVSALTYGHVLDYGIHAYALVHGIMGPGVEAARALDAVGGTAQLRWRDGRTAVVDVLPPDAGHGFYVTVAGAGGVHQADAAGDDLYGPFLDRTLAHLGGEADLPLTFAELVEPERSVLAARASARHGGAWVALRDDPRLCDGACDGHAFAAGYARRRRAALGLPPR